MSSAPKLHEVLNLHDANAEGLRESMGDGFLLKNNSVFASVRAEFLRQGFRFTTEDFCHYAVLPYVSLAAILQRKEVPYFDNVSIMREIESKHPQRFRCDDVLKVKPNYGFHESAHCIADVLLRDLQLADPAMSADRKTAFKLMMAESFANTLETLGNAPNETPEARLFYELNSYITLNRKTHEALKEAIGEFGLASVFRVLYLGYLYSNCLFAEVNHRVYQRVIDAMIEDGARRKKAMDSQALRKTFNHAFELSMDFRVRTTGFYCAFSGLKTDVVQLLRFDVMDVFQKNPSVAEFIRRAENVLLAK